VKSEQLQPKFGGMGKAPLWQIDPKILGKGGLVAYTQ